jgi:hypothetical protein
MYDSLDFLNDTLKATGAAGAIEIIEQAVPHSQGDIESLIKTSLQVVIGLLYIYNFFFPKKATK